MTTVLDPQAGYITLINIFEVEPERADELLAALYRWLGETGQRG